MKIIKSLLKRLNSRDAGFTLIELIVVMIIIGILAAVAIPVFLNRRAEANRLFAAQILHQDYPKATVGKVKPDRSTDNYGSYTGTVDFGNRTDTCSFHFDAKTMECKNTQGPTTPAPTSSPQPTVTVTETVTAPAS